MAKSMRSKAKRSFRRTKRESGVFAAAHAARLERINQKLAAKVNADKDGDAPMQEEEEEAEEERVEVQEGEGEGENAAMSGEPEDATSTATSKRVSTSGPRGSRREEWRKSKGMSPRSKGGNRMNKHGVIASSKRSGRSKRRR